MRSPNATPERTSSAPPPPHRGGSGPRAGTQSGTRARPRVLIVEDHADTSEMYAWRMRAAGWLVEVVSNGADALVVAASFEPDVILMDLMLPIVGGLEAIGKLKRDDDTKDVPIVAITAYGRAVGEHEARAAGCDRFVAKPCEPDALHDVLHELVAARDAGDAGGDL